MVKLLKAQLKELDKLNRQRIIWLRLSGFVSIAVIAIIVDWSYVKDTKWGYLVFSLGLILSVVWWYWTMVVVRRLIDQRKIESVAIIEMVEDIKEMKNDVKGLDNSK